MATRKKTAKTTSEKTKAPAKKAIPKKAAARKEDLVVFALRMTLAERTRLHKTAGPRGATRLARAVLVAAANQDDAAFRTAVKEASARR